MSPSLRKRQAFNDNNNGNGNNGYAGYDGEVSWWWTPAGIATRYAIVAVLFAAILAFFVGGYFHAQRRARKGLPLLPYHRWMIRQPTYYNNGGYPPPRNVQYAHHGDPNSQYMMEGYPPPPPAYHNTDQSPPTYQPPPGASKAMADQNFRETNRAGEGSASAATSS